LITHGRRAPARRPLYDPATVTDLLTPALRIGAGLLAQARELDDGSLSWGRGADRDRLPAPDTGPFNGRCGEALLFAALHAATGDPAFEEASLRTLLSLRRGLPDERYRSDLADRVVFGLAGVGGILYTLVRAAGFLGRPELLESAEHLAGVVTEERIAADGQFDIIWGSAGALLGLLALADAGSAGALHRAERCAEHLLTRRAVDPESGLRAWNTLRGVPSSGFAHGASGIAHALLQVYRRTEAAPFYEAALEAFAFERTLYREEILNWMDSRGEPEDQPVMWSWCHGAPGIGLARLGVLGRLRGDDEAGIAEDLHRAITATLAARVPGVDTICCGFFGRIDFLLEAGHKLGNPALERHARRIAGERLGRAGEQGYLLTPDDEIEEHLRAGFWQDLGGTAYTLLRLTDPARYPCVLAMA
jgi:lantibiotic modifying enzyme